MPRLADARHAVQGTGKPGVPQTKTIWLFLAIPNVTPSSKRQGSSSKKEVHHTGSDDGRCLTCYPLCQADPPSQADIAPAESHRTQRPP